MMNLRLDRFIADFDRLEELRSLREELAIICFIFREFGVICEMRVMKLITCDGRRSLTLHDPDHSKPKVIVENMLVHCMLIEQDYKSDQRYIAEDRHMTNLWFAST